MPVRIRVRGASWEGHVHDLSSTGARIEGTGLDPMEGALLELEFSLLTNSAPLAIRGEVVRSTHSGGFSVRFVQLPERTEAVLRLLIPKIAKGRLAEDQDDCPTYSGALEIKIGTELHESIAKLAEAEGLDAVQWVRDSLERSARDALDAQKSSGAQGQAASRKVRIG